MTNRLLTGFAMVALAIGAYNAFTHGNWGLAVILTCGTIAAAIPTLLERK
jgi:hypothetical protein